MNGRVKKTNKITAIILCVMLCMTSNMDVFAVSTEHAEQSFIASETYVSQTAEDSVRKAEDISAQESATGTAKKTKPVETAERPIEASTADELQKDEHLVKTSMADEGKKDERTLTAERPVETSISDEGKKDERTLTAETETDEQPVETSTADEGKKDGQSVETSTGDENEKDEQAIEVSTADETETDEQPVETSTGDENETDTQPTGTPAENETESEREDSAVETERGTESETDSEELTAETESGTESETDSEELAAETEGETELDTETDIEKVRERLREELNQRLREDGFIPSGYIDSGIEAESLEGGGITAFSLSESSVPSKYSAVDNGLGTSIKNQGSWGACWSFAAVATAESMYKKITGTEADMSESHLVNFFYNDNMTGPDGGLEGDAVIPLAKDKVNNGGNNMFTTFAMAGWTGIADERTHESLVYPSAEETGRTKELNISQEYAYADIVHMQNAYWINKSDADAVKQAIMDNGAVAAYYKHDESYSSHYVDKSEYSGPTVYYNYTTGFGDNHAIAVVGWDDDFDKNNFKYTAINHGVTQKSIPKNNGAWLIKNSWGTGYGDDGYFWMSYEDLSLSDSMLAFEFEKADNYDHIYQYDGSAGVRYQSADTITAAAVYTSTGYQMIKAVGIGVASAATDYTVEIYTNLSDAGNPQSGVLSAQTNGTTTFQGYHTIKLEKWTPVTEGELFSIVVTLSGGKIDGEPGAAIFIDQSYDNGSAVRFVAAANPGETFVKNNESWTDAAGEGEENKITYRIKAYTSDGEFDAPQENIQLTSEMVKEIDSQEYNGTQNEPDVEINYMGERLVKDVDYHVAYINNTMAADRTSENAPRAIITGTGKYTGTVEQTFTIYPKEITEEMVESGALMYNGTVQDDLVLNYGEVRLVKGKDYDIVFDRQPCNVGNYTADITGINNYTGQLRLKVAVAKTTLSEDMLGLLNTADGSIVMPDTPFACEYTGAAIKPTVKVAAYGAEIPANNYSVSYKNNVNVGTGTITVTGKGNCQGKVTRNFTIIPKSIESGYSVSVAKAVYSGKALTPAVTVKQNNKALKKGRDYTVTYEKNVHAADMGDAEPPKVMVTGIGNYAGIIGQPFTILPKEVAEGSISAQIAYDEKGSSFRVLAGKTELLEGQDYRLSGIYKAGTNEETDRTKLVPGEKYNIEVTLLGNYRVKNKEAALKKNIVSKRDIRALNIRFANENAMYIYNGKAQKPAVVITDAEGKTVSSSNYTLTYSNNINACEAQAADGAKVTVTGKGAYAGTFSLSFAINKKELDISAVQPIKDQAYTQKELRPAVKVLDGKKLLKAGKDYACIDYADNVNVAWDENGDVAAKAYVEIQVSDNYRIGGESTVKQYFRITPVSISSVSLSSAYYTGQAAMPDKIVVKAGKLTVPEDCYEVIAENNIQVSSRASLTVSAKKAANYTGSRTKKYSVVKQELKKLILPVIPDQPYLKQPITVDAYRIKDLDGKELDEGQYDVTVKNNNKVGKATVTYKAKSEGIYKGSATVKFNITKATMSQAIDDEAARTISKQYTGVEITLTDEELRQLAPIKDAESGYPLPYTAAYSKNVNAGTAVVCLTGTDYLQGSQNVYFTITPKSADAFEIVTGAKQLSYNNGSPVYLELKEVRDNDTVLKAGRDFTYSYINADKKGIACLTITGVGNYSGTRFVYYNIG